MLSPFLKKLLFVRQFIMTDGKIEVLGQQQVMLPLTALASMQNDQTFDLISREMKKSMEAYGKKMGGSANGMVKTVQDIYETTGLGKMEILKLDTAGKKVILRMQNIRFERTDVVEGVVCGLFTYLLSKELTRKDIKVTKKSTYIDISIS